MRPLRVGRCGDDLEKSRAVLRRLGGADAVGAFEVGRRARTQRRDVAERTVTRHDVRRDLFLARKLEAVTAQSFEESNPGVVELFRGDEALRARALVAGEHSTASGSTCAGAATAAPVDEASCRRQQQSSNACALHHARTVFGENDHRPVASVEIHPARRDAATEQARQPLFAPIRERAERLGLGETTSREPRVFGAAQKLRSGEKTESSMNARYGRGALRTITLTSVSSTLSVSRPMQLSQRPQPESVSFSSLK